MKLIRISFLLVFLPSIYAFTPNAFVARTKASSQQLNVLGFGRDKEKGSLIPNSNDRGKKEGGFVSKLLGDKIDKKKIAKEAASLAVQMAKQKTMDVSHDLISGVKAVFTGKDNGIFKRVPSKEMTGVEPEMTQLCATISAQLYNCTSFDEFKLSTKDNKCDLFIYDNHGSLFNATPPFCVAITGKTMILGWRGTSSLMDLLTDGAAAPQSNLAWRKHAKTIKAQGPMTSVVLNDIATHEEAIIKKAKELGITEIITTGQSLGGGACQIGHLVVRAQIQDEASPWHELDGVNVRSVAFCGPMTTVLMDNASEETDKFVEELVANSCNFIYMNDIVPRGYAYLEFLHKFIDNSTGHLSALLPEEKKTSMIFNLAKSAAVTFVQDKVDKMINIVDKQAALQAGFEVLFHYRHVGKLVYYESEDAKPRVLVDEGHGSTKTGRGTFRSVEYKNVPDPLGDFMYWHMHIIRGPGLAYPWDELSS